jgi:hypothetical protein
VRPVDRDLTVEGADSMLTGVELENVSCRCLRGGESKTNTLEVDNVDDLFIWKRLEVL